MRGITGAAVALGALALLAGPAAAEPATGPRETVDQSYTTTSPGTATGLDFTSSYHADADPQSPPPPMRKMVFYPPAGFRFDTTIPGQCTATDVQLELQGRMRVPPTARSAGARPRGSSLCRSTIRRC